MGAYDLANLKKRENVAPGIAAYVLMAKKSDFTTLAGIAVPTADTPLADTVKVKTAHVFGAGKAWSQWNLAKDKNQFESAAEGDPSFRQFKQTVTIFVPGSYAEVHAIMAMLLNEDMICLVKDANCSANMFYQMGNECQGATINPKFTTSTTASGVKGYEVVVEYSGPCVQIYEAAIGAIIADDAGSNIVMNFNTNVEVINGGVTAEAVALNANQNLTFAKQGVLAVGNGAMYIEEAGVLKMTIGFNNAYTGKALSYIDTAGVGHSLVFINATVDLV